MKNKILIITHTEDNECVERVSEFIRNNNAEVVRFDVDKYPLKSTLTSKFENNEWKIILNDEGKFSNLEDISAIWFRRAYNFGRGLNEVLEKKFLSAAMGEVRQTLMGFIESVPVYSLGKTGLYRRMDSKEEQLKVAQRLGLNIPETCITNNPEEAKKFVLSHKNGAIAKMQSAFAIYEDGVENVVFTNLITEKNLEEVDDLVYCPMKFQEKLEKQKELRITIVGRKIFAFEIDSQQMETSKIDWRKEGITLIDQWKPYQLPKDIEEKLLKLLDFYNTDYGAIDMIVTPENKYYFIEINSAGEFFWLDLRTEGNQISKEIADLLCNKVARRDNSQI